MQLCSVCFNTTLDDPCPICSDQSRDQTVIAVVTQPSDIPILEQRGFTGRYHVLHGVISPRNGIGPDQLKIQELANRLKNLEVSELIICTPKGMEGDGTAMSVMRAVDVALSPNKIKVRQGEPPLR
jgi:recombination protein RecR